MRSCNPHPPSPLSCNSRGRRCSMPAAQADGPDLHRGPCRCGRRVRLLLHQQRGLPEHIILRTGVGGKWGTLAQVWESRSIYPLLSATTSNCFQLLPTDYRLPPHAQLTAAFAAPPAGATNTVLTLNAIARDHMGPDQVWGIRCGASNRQSCTQSLITRPFFYPSDYR